MSSTGNIASDSIDRANELPEFHSGLHFTNPFLRALPLAEATNVRGGSLEGVAEVGCDLLPGIIDFSLSHPQILAFEPVELARVSQQSRVAALAHVIDDFGCRFFRAREIEGSTVGEALERSAITFAVDELHRFKSDISFKAALSRIVIPSTAANIRETPSPWMLRSKGSAFELPAEQQIPRSAKPIHRV